MAEQYNRRFEGIWIPANIWLSEELTLQEKIFLVEIKSLDNEQGCYASNDHFGKLFQLSKSRCSEVINKLKEKGLIKIYFIHKENSKQVERRVIRVNRQHEIFNEGIRNLEGGIREVEGGIRNPEAPPSENAKDNNTVINNTSNNTNNKKTSRLKYEISDMNHAKYLFELMLINNPTAKEPDLEKWANEFRLIRERDKRTDEQIQYLIKWTQQHSFWRTNVLSPASLREKWDRLVLQVKAEKEGGKNGAYRQVAQANEHKVDLGF